MHEYACSLMSNSFWPHDCSLPGSSVHGVSQARILEYQLGCQFVLQGVLLTQGSSLYLLSLLHWLASPLPLPPPGKPIITAERLASWPPISSAMVHSISVRHQHVNLIQEEPQGLVQGIKLQKPFLNASNIACCLWLQKFTDIKTSQISGYLSCCLWCSERTLNQGQRGL